MNFTKKYLVKLNEPFENKYMISNGFFILVALVLYINTAQAVDISSDQTVVKEKTAAPSSSTDLFYLCKREKQTRWLRAYKLDNGKCQTIYSKEGYLQVISSASYFTMCEGVLQSVQKNLEEGGFKCNLTQQYSVLELE